MAWSGRESLEKPKKSKPSLRIHNPPSSAAARLIIAKALDRVARDDKDLRLLELAKSLRESVPRQNI